MQVEIYFNPFNNEKNPFGSAAAIYEFVNCWPGPDGNQDNSWLRFLLFTNSLAQGKLMANWWWGRGGVVDNTIQFCCCIPSVRGMAAFVPSALSVFFFM